VIYDDGSVAGLPAVARDGNSLTFPLNFQRHLYQCNFNFFCSFVKTSPSVHDFTIVWLLNAAS
jgi:hypothetical protein